MKVNAKMDYAVRAMAELAAAGTGGSHVKKQVLSEAQSIPANYLENILRELRAAGLVRTFTGPDGGYALTRPAATITLAEIIRAVEGPLAAVQGVRPEDLSYDGAARCLVEVWVAVRASLRSVLDQVTLADLVSGDLPAPVRALAADPDAWHPR